MAKNKSKIDPKMNFAPTKIAMSAVREIQAT